MYHKLSSHGKLWDQRNEGKMIFVLSYFRLALFHPVHCMEPRNRVERSNSFEIRLECLFPYTPSITPPPPFSSLPTFLPQNRCQRRVADREITASVSRFSSIALVHIHQEIRSIDFRERTGFRLETRNSFRRCDEK